MDLRVLDFRGGEPDPDLVDEVVEHLRAGGIVAHPTETVYGFGCLLREEAIAEVQRLKGRDASKPFLVLIPDMASADALAWTDAARELAGVFWPGALTLVLRDPTGHFPEGVRSDEGAVAVRISPHPLAHRIVKALGEPMISTSANPADAEPALTAEEAVRAAAEVSSGPSLWILDTGPLPHSTPSTIVDCTTESPRVIREGALPPYRLRCVLPGMGDPGQGSEC